MRLSSITGRRRAPLLALGAVLCLGSCAPEQPYVRSDYLVHQRGQVQVCYNESRANLSQAQTLADEVCREYDRTARFQLQQELQCNWTSPTLAIFACVARPGESPAPLSRQVAPLRRSTPQ